VENQLGTLLVAFLSTDFAPWIQRCRQGMSQSEYEQFCKVIRAYHPLYDLAMMSVVFQDYPIEALGQWLNEMEALQDLAKAIVDATLLPQNDGLSTVERFCLYKYSGTYQNRTIESFFYSLSNNILAEREITINGEEAISTLNTHEGLSPPFSVESRMVYGTDDLRSFLLLQIQEMVFQNSILKKCDYCGRYFLPFSKKAVYCDHIHADSGKSCKELAAKQKFEKKVAADEGLALYRRRNRTYNMRVSRAPKVYLKKDYLAWKVAANAALEQYSRGELTLEQLDRALALPDRK
jgi:hypothetical protein